MAYIDKPPLAISSAGNAERMITISQNTLMPKVLEPFAIVSFQPNILTMDDLGIDDTVSIDHATIVLGN